MGQAFGRRRMGFGGGGFAFGSGGGAPPVVIPLRVAATRGEVPNLIGPAVSITNQLRKIFRSAHTLGPVAFKELRLVYGNYAGNSSGEALPGNTTDLVAALEIGGTWAGATFGGLSTLTMTDGQALAVSDAILPAAFGLSEFAASSAVYQRHSRTVASGGKFVRAENVSSGWAGDGAAQCDPATGNQVNGTGALSTTGNYTAYAECIKPLAIIGLPVGSTAWVCVGGVGDSILYKNNDTVAGGGWFQRGLASVNGAAMPYIRMAIPSERAQGFVAGSRRQQLFQYLTHVVCNYGTNDLGAARTATQTIGDLRTIWQAAKAAGVQRVEQIPILPRTTGAWTLPDGSDQTYPAGFEPSSPTYKSGLNAAIATNIGSNGLDATLDFTPDVQLTGNPDKWAAPGATTDGLHPSTAKHIVMATTFMVRAATWTAT